MNGDFLDANVILYLFDETDERKRRTAERLVTASIESGRGSISYQVVQETLNVLTGKLAVIVPPEKVRRFLEDVLVPLWNVVPRTRFKLEEAIRQTIDELLYAGVLGKRSGEWE